jgi:Rrf2 family protein
MMITQKCQYALRAIFELSRRAGRGPVKISQIAEAQAIPPQFLETILNQLKQAGIVESRRGVRGGYVLLVSPKKLTAGDVIRQIDGLGKPVKCVVGGGEECPMRGNCAFEPMWDKAGTALAEIFDAVTFQDFIDKHQAAAPARPKPRPAAGPPSQQSSNFAI